MPAKKPAAKPPFKTQDRKANPADFGKTTTPVRERMAEEIKDTPPEERLKKGR